MQLTYLFLQFKYVKSFFLIGNLQKTSVSDITFCACCRLVVQLGRPSRKSRHPGEIHDRVQCSVDDNEEDLAGDPGVRVHELGGVDVAGVTVQLSGDDEEDGVSEERNVAGHEDRSEDCYGN